MVLRTMATTASTATGSTTSSTANTGNNNNAILEDYLASPSPRCCACDKRGGYQQAENEAPSSPPAAKRPSIAVPASSVTIDDAANRLDCDGQTAANDRGASACVRKHDAQDHDPAHHDSRRGPMDTREEQLVVHLQECLKHMTHLRDWLRLLDQELG